MIGRTLLHTIKHALGIEAAHTQTTSAERECLANLAKGKRRVVEIGVYEGSTTRLLAENMPREGTIYAVDPFIPGRIGICWGRQTARREVSNSGGARVEFIERYSYDAVVLIDGQFDLIFIDGDHSLEGITRDWADWSGRVVVDGVIALHDTRVPLHNPNVADLGSHQYFETHIRHDQRFELLEQVDSLSLMRRRQYA